MKKRKSVSLYLYTFEKNLWKLSNYWLFSIGAEIENIIIVDEVTWFQFESIRTINVLVFVSLFFLLRQFSLQFINFYDDRNRFHLNDTNINVSGHWCFRDFRWCEFRVRRLLSTDSNKCQSRRNSCPDHFLKGIRTSFTDRNICPRCRQTSSYKRRVIRAIPLNVKNSESDDDIPCRTSSVYFFIFLRHCFNFFLD